PLLPDACNHPLPFAGFYHVDRWLRVIYSAAQKTISMEAKMPVPFIDETHITYGPKKLAHRFYRAAHKFALERGVTISYCTFAELVEANRANQDKGWWPIFPCFDAERAGFEERHGIALLGRNAAGYPVLSQAVLHKNW